MAAAVVPHSLELETQANLGVVDNTVGTQTTVAPCLPANSEPTCLWEGWTLGRARR